MRARPTLVIATFALALLSFGAEHLLGQVAAVSVPACLDSIPAAALHPTIAYLTSRYPDSLVEGRRSMVNVIDNFTQSVAFRVRSMLDTSTTRLPAAEPALGWREMGGAVDIVWRSDGSLTAHVDPDRNESLVLGHRAASLALRAVESMQAEGERLIVPDTSLHDSVTFSLRYRVPSFKENGDVVPLALRVGVPAFSVMVPWSASVRQRPASGGIRYPQRLFKLGVGGVVLGRFVVDDAGRYVSGSYEPLFPQDLAKPQGDEVGMWLEFADAVGTALPRMEFYAATIAGCAVPQLVQQPFTFKITGR